jgi:DNA adenine methylase
MPKALTPPLKWHGGKYYLAPKIVALMPRHLHYVEPFAGGLAVLLARDPTDQRLWAGTDGSTGGVSEVVNDKSRELTNFWAVLQDVGLFQEWHRRLQCTPLSRREWDAARAFLDANPVPADCRASVEHAEAFFVCCRQSLSGRMRGFTSLTRNRTRRGVNGNLSEWLGAVEGLPSVHERLRQVVVENMDALDLIRRDDEPTTLFYCDPPYLHATRATTGEYAHEMSDQDHGNLLGVLASLRGKFMLSGYRSDLYDEAAAEHGWRREDFDLPNNAAGGKSKRRMTESLWMNFSC